MILSWIDFHLVLLTMSDHMLRIHFANKATTIPMAKKARTKHDSARTVDLDETKILLHQCKPYNMEIDRRQTI